MPDSLYIHIPFCIQKCIYCDFFSVPYDDALVKAYMNALCKELSLKKGSARTLKTIYIGGGTPSLLPDDCFAQLFNCLIDNFILSPSIEITVEANPRTLHRHGIKTMISSGVNRISIGVQSLNNAELKTLGRVHTAEDALGSIELVKKSGITNFSIDLMYGIPGQTMDSWHKSISEAIAHSALHISTYELTPEQNTLLFELITSDQIMMPDEELVLEMYNHAIDHLARRGYEHYEISNFALPGFKCVHNLNCWDRGEYIGAGAGAHSFIDNVRSRNTKDLHEYLQSCAEGKIPVLESTALLPVDILSEFIFLGLRKMQGINIIEAKELGLDLIDAAEELLAEGLVDITHGYLRLTRKGTVLSNSIIVRLFEKSGL
jgi:oxygen-independent coproporphyrinogen III oxidase